MRKYVNSRCVSVFTVCISGLIFALTFGLPLYIYCALWFGWIFPTQNYAMDLSIFLVALFFFLAMLVFLCIGFWRVGSFTAKKTGNMDAGIIAGLWMGIVVVGIMWLVRIVSTQFGAPMIKYPGNPLGGLALFGGTYFFFPYVVTFAALIIGMSGANSVDLPQANIITD